MAKATASMLTHIRRKGNSKCHIVVTAPNGSTFKATTIIAPQVRDAGNNLLWAATPINPSGGKRLKAQLQADPNNDTQRGGVDSGTLTITLTDSAGTGLPPDIDAAVDPLVVDYVDGSD